MSYFELFPYISLLWGTLGLTVSLRGERAYATQPKLTPGEDIGRYKMLAKLWLIIGWGYLTACIPIFREGRQIAEAMQFFYSMIAILLSLEVWIIFLATLVAISLAKKSHDPEFSSVFLQWHWPLKRLLKPMLQLVSVAHIANALYFIL